MDFALLRRLETRDQLFGGRSTAAPAPKLFLSASSPRVRETSREQSQGRFESIGVLEPAGISKDGTPIAFYGMPVVCCLIRLCRFILNWQPIIS